MTPLEELKAELKRAQEELDSVDAAYVDNKHAIIERIEVIKKRIREIGPCRVRIRHCVPCFGDIDRVFESEDEARAFIDAIVEDKGLYNDISAREVAFIPIGSIVYMRVIRTPV